MFDPGRGVRSADSEANQTSEARSQQDLGAENACFLAPSCFAAPSIYPTRPTKQDLPVSLIIPVHQDGAAFRACVASIVALDPAPHEIIVVADGAAPDVDELVRPRGWRLIRTAMRSGPAVARNLGARQAQGDLLFFLDSDVLSPATAIGQVVQLFRDHPDIDAVIGSYDDAPAAPNFLSQYKNLCHHYVHQNGQEKGYTFWGACGAIRRQVFQDLGGFDESYLQPSVEDIELGYRLTAAGHRIRLCKTLQVKHLKRWTALSLIRTDFFRRALPWTELILHYGRMENDLNIDRSNRIKVLLVGFLAALLATAWFWPIGLIGAALVAGALLILDAPLWQFFYQKRGWLFTARTVPWHWLGYAYSGLGFAIGAAGFLFRGGLGRSQSRAQVEWQPLSDRPGREAARG